MIIEILNACLWSAYFSLLFLSIFAFVQIQITRKILKSVVIFEVKLGGHWRKWMKSRNCGLTGSQPKQPKFQNVRTISSIVRVNLNLKKDTKLRSDIWIMLRIISWIHFPSVKLDGPSQHWGLYELSRTQNWAGTSPESGYPNWGGRIPGE